MTLLIIVVLNAAVLALIALAVNRRTKSLSAEATGARGAKQITDQKYTQLRSELSALKEDNSRKAKQLDELREIAKRRLKKEASPMTTENLPAAFSPQTPSFDVALKTVQQQAEQAHEEELAKLKAHYEDRLAKLEAQVTQRKQSIDKNKKSLASQLTANVDGLSEDVIMEMGRLLKRSEHAEKLFAATRGKLQMSQERFSEMQKRYFGVCRELALATGNSLGISDEDFRNQAEDLLNISEKSVEA
ncbi:MAG: hypothetical protein V4534_05050 [Myxococcota bacterium]